MGDKRKLEEEIKALKRKLNRSPNEEDHKEMMKAEFSPQDQLTVQALSQQFEKKYYDACGKEEKEFKIKTFFLWGILLGIAGSYFSSYILKNYGKIITSILFHLSLAFLILSVVVMVGWISWHWDFMKKRPFNFEKSAEHFIHWQKWRENLEKEIREKEKKLKGR